MGAGKLDPRNHAGAAVLAFAAVAATHLGAVAAGSPPRLLDAAQAGSWSHLAATAAEGAGACIAAYGLTGDGDRRAWGMAAVAFTVLFADGVTRAHDHLPGGAVLLVPVLGVLAAAVLGLSAGRPQRRAVVTALCLLGASLVAHVVGHAILRLGGWGADTVPYHTKVVLKEGLEFAGWVVLVPALWALRVRLPERTRAAARPAS